MKCYKSIISAFYLRNTVVPFAWPVPGLRVLASRFVHVLRNMKPEVSDDDPKRSARSAEIGHCILSSYVAVQALCRDDSSLPLAPALWPAHILLPVPSKRFVSRLSVDITRHRATGTPNSVLTALLEPTFCASLWISTA